MFQLVEWIFSSEFAPPLLREPLPRLVGRLGCVHDSNDGLLGGLGELLPGLDHLSQVSRDLTATIISPRPLSPEKQREGDGTQGVKWENDATEAYNPSIVS